MKRYVDGYVLPIKKKNIAAYKKVATKAGKVWIKHGALQYTECVGDDLKPDMQGVKIRQFPSLVRTKPDETVIFSFITYKSRAHRDRVNARVMKDSSMNDEWSKPNTMPFDVKRMAFGGFETLVNLEEKH